MMKGTNFFGRGRRPLPGIAAAALLTLSLTACDTESLLEVEDPDVTLPEDLYDPSNLPALRATVLGDFAVALGGTSSTTANLGVAHITGLFADEFWHSGTYSQNRTIDRRQMSDNNSFLAALTRNLYRGVNISRIGIQSYEQNDPNTAAHAELVSLQSYLYTFLGENFCSAIPFSQDVNGVFEYGTPETNQQVLERALANFDRAITIATQSGNAQQLNLARMGKARVLMDLNRYADAVAVVAQVPTSFVYQVEYSSNTVRQYNGIWGNNFGRREIAMSDREGGNGVNFRVGSTATANQVVTADPRLPWSFANGAADTRSVHFFIQKYPAQGTPIVLASGTEARLIEAEAALARGQSSAYLATLNDLRDGVGLPALTDPGTPAGRVRQFFEERAKWLYGTGQRLNDLRRMVRQYNPAIPGEFTTEKVFPSGTYIRPGVEGPRADGVYGTDVNIPLVFDEENNPNYNPGQCVTTEV
jgi:hypothetical protein